MERKKIEVIFDGGSQTSIPLKKENIERKHNYYIVLWINLLFLLCPLFLPNQTQFTNKTSIFP